MTKNQLRQFWAMAPISRRICRMLMALGIIPLMIYCTVKTFIQEFWSAVRDASREPFYVWHEFKEMMAKTHPSRQPRPVPPYIYYDPEADNFYQIDTRRGMGHTFYNRWHHLRDHFPQRGET